MIDSHAHIISEFYDNIDDIVNFLKNKGVLKVINCADSVETSYEVLDLSKKYEDFLIPTVGIHPGHVEDLDKLDEIVKLLESNKFCAIGEIGLDYHYGKEDKEDQIKIFEAQLDLAEKYNLPVIIHTRDSIQDCYDILKKRKLKGIIHCYSGSVEMAELFIKLGYKLGIGGVVTFKNSKLYEVIEKFDIANFVLETDSPFLAPEPFRGTLNNPYNIYYVAIKIAQIKGISFDEVISSNIKNIGEVFDI